jgi:hypothetical protein
MDGHQEPLALSIPFLGITMEDTGNHSDDDNDGLVSFLECGIVNDVINNDTDLVNSDMSDQLDSFDLSSSQVPPISNASLRDVFGHIVLFYDKSSSNIKYLIGELAIKMKEIVCEGIKLTNSINIDVKQSSMTYINSLMKDVVQRYQQAFAHKTDAFSNTIGPNTSVNRPLPALCGTTHKQCFKRHSEHAALSQQCSKMSCG